MTHIFKAQRGRLVPSKGQLPICYSYFRQAPTRSAQVKQPCIAFDAIRLVTKVLVLDLVHISFWQKKMVLCRAGYNQNINDRGKKSKAKGDFSQKLVEIQTLTGAA